MISGPFANRRRLTTCEHQGWVYRNVLYPVLANGEKAAGTLQLAREVTISNAIPAGTMLEEMYTMTEEVLRQNTSNVLLHAGIRSRDEYFKRLLGNHCSMNDLGHGIPLNKRYINQCYFRASLKVTMMHMERSEQNLLHAYSDFDGQTGVAHRNDLRNVGIVEREETWGLSVYVPDRYLCRRHQW